MKKLLFAISAIAFATTAVMAGPVEDREALMKERGKSIGVLSKMAKGETAFDAAAALEELKALQANIGKTDIDTLWAAGTTGNTVDTPESSPKIWEDMAGYKADEKEYEDAVAAAAVAPPADVAALRASVGAIGKTCGGCHEAFRISKN